MGKGPNLCCYGYGAENNCRKTMISKLELIEIGEIFKISIARCEKVRQFNNKDHLFRPKFAREDRSESF